MKEIDLLRAFHKRRNKSIQAQTKGKGAQKMKARLIHKDLVLKAFENYIQKQMLSSAQVQIEIVSFRRELAKSVVESNQEKEGK